MIRKLIMIIAFAVAVAIIADHYGVITLPSLKRPAVLDNRDQMVYKTKNLIDKK